MTISRSSPSPRYRFFLYDPDGDGLSFWPSEKERDEAAKLVIQGYLQDSEWWDGVECVMAGIATHKAGEINIQHPVGEIDEDGYDEEGDYWPESDATKCDFALLPLEEES